MKPGHPHLDTAVRRNTHRHRTTSAATSRGHKRQASGSCADESGSAAEDDAEHSARGSEPAEEERDGRTPPGSGGTIDVDAPAHLSLGSFCLVDGSQAQVEHGTIVPLDRQSNFFVDTGNATTTKRGADPFPRMPTVSMGTRFAKKVHSQSGFYL